MGGCDLAERVMVGVVCGLWSVNLHASQRAQSLAGQLRKKDFIFENPRAPGGPTSLGSIIHITK